ncbi:MAG TPA: ABC transporter substrate-binding protein [Actinomycetes bacterium]
MTPVRRRPRQAIVAGAVLFTLMIASACASHQADERAAAVAFDRALHDRLPASILQRGTIRVGGSDPYPPAAFYAPDGRTFVGFEPDLAAEMGRVLGVRFEFVNLSFSDLLPQLRRHKIDIVMASMTDNAEREKQADFVNYFQAGTAIIVQRGNPRGISALKDLCGKVVAVAEGTVQVDLLRRTQKGCAADKRIDVRSYGDNANALLQLRTGRAAAVLSDYPPAVHLSTDRRTSAQYQLAATTQYEPSPYGIAVAKDQTELRDCLRDALEQVMRSGAYAEVLQRWGVPSGALETATINAGGGATAG